MQEILKVEGLWVEGRLPTGENVPIVKNVSFTVNQGEVVALIGESGSGKTTISLAALGYARPGCRIKGGKILLDGENILSLDNTSKREMRGRSTAYVAQSATAAFNPGLTIGYQVTESPVIHGLMTLEDAKEQALSLYRRLDLPFVESINKRYPHQVSGGQLQRLMAAMALSCNPRLLVLDEPTTALDVTTQIEVLTAFKEIIRQQNTAAIYVTHDLAVVSQMADRIIVLLDGEVKETGAAKDLTSRPTHPYTIKLMDAVKPVPKSTADTISKSDDHEPALVRANEITAGYGRIRKKIILRDVSLDIPKGSVVGVIGESGCGKSTLARVIAGLLPPEQGQISLGGTALAPRAAKRSRDDLKRIQIVFQMPDTALNPRQRIVDILGRPLKFYMGYSSGKRRSRVSELLEMVELPKDILHRYPGDLSGGQKQRINLARALAAEPELILCDEVTSALDTIVGAAVIELLQNLRKHLDLAYLFISHDLSTVSSFADQVMVLYAGQTAEFGPLSAVLSPPYHPYTRLLLSSVPELRPGWLEEILVSRDSMRAVSRAVEITDRGCPFYPRCYLAINGTCDEKKPPIRSPGPGHSIYCHREIDELRGAMT
jgi:peptide/nickel transport system ATP-binding protein